MKYALKISTYKKFIINISREEFNLNQELYVESLLSMSACKPLFFFQVYHSHSTSLSLCKYFNLNGIIQGQPTCSSRATCGSLKDYLWLSINVPKFPFHFCVIKKIKSVAYSFQGNYTGQLDFYNSLSDVIIYLKSIIVPYVFQNVF